MSWCTYFNAEQIAEALVWDCCSEFPHVQAYSLPCVLRADLLSEAGTGWWRRGMGALAAGGKSHRSLFSGPVPDCPTGCNCCPSLADSAALQQQPSPGWRAGTPHTVSDGHTEINSKKLRIETENTSGNYFPSQHPKHHRWNFLKSISEISDTSYSVWPVLFLH